MYQTVFRFVCVFFGRKQCEADYSDLIWKLMRNANCIILLTVSVSVCIMPPLLYETHVIVIRPQNQVLLSIEHCLLVWFMP